MSVTIAQARSYLTAFARNAGDNTTYPVLMQDLAIFGILSDFIRITRCVRQANSVSLVASNSAVDFTAVTGFKPSRIKSVSVNTTADYSASDVARGVDPVGLDEVLQLQGECGTTSTGTPRKIAFSADASGIVFPTPKAAGTMAVIWYPLVTPWTFGQSGGTDLVIPADHVVRVLQTGGPAALQFNDPEHGYAGPAFTAYRNYRDSMRGADDAGAKSFQRQPVDILRRRGW